MNNIQSIHDVIRTLGEKLQSCCGTHVAAEQEIWWMLEKLLQTTKVRLLQQQNLCLSSEQKMTLALWIKQRMEEHKPLQYILGSVPFTGLDIIVRSPILIPRPETEEWVVWLIAQLGVMRDKQFTILDLCTGSGCIALALAKSFPLASIVGVDINPDAIELATMNAKHNSISNVRFVQSDLFASLDATLCYDVIVSNPPYVSYAAYKTLDPSVRLWEDQRALVAGDDGYDFYKRIAQQARNFLCKKDGGVTEYSLPRLIVEIGQAQSSVKDIFQEHGFVQVQVYRDQQGVDRWVVAYLTEKIV